MDRYRNLLIPIGMLLMLLADPAGAGGVFDKLARGESPFNLGAREPEFLHPDEAFRFSSEETSSGVRLAWDIAPGYYLYRDRFKIASADPAVAVSLPELPAGEMKDDPEFGRVPIFRDHIAFDVAVATSAPVALEVTYQGCAEDGICYPPIKRPLQVSLNPLRSAGATESVPATVGAGPNDSAPWLPALTDSGVLSADTIAAQLGERGWLSVAALFFGFGLLLSFTPCVFPMIPILSGIIVGQRQPLSTGRAFGLSLAYVVAMALTYALVGMVAGLFGHNLQATFQTPAAILTFSAVFVLLALSMFGFYELQLPARWQTRLDGIARSKAGGSYSGVAAMGVLSAIIVGPCVAPPLAGALLYISHQGSAAVGGLALFSMGMGMGMLLLVVGTTAGRILPSSGRWMESIKRFFGVLLLAVAIWFLGRILPGPVVVALWAVLLVSCGVFLGALETATGEAHEPLDTFVPKLKKGLGFVLLVYGAVLIVGAGAGADDPLQPLAPLVGGDGGTHGELEFTAIKSSADLDAAIAIAQRNGQRVMLDVYADWCIECKHLEKQTFGDRAVQAALSDTMLLRADVTDNDAIDQSLLKRFELFGPPAVLFFSPDGDELRTHRVLGFVGPEAFSAHLERVRRG